MTRRKPPGMSFESFVERQIREAQEEGQFDDLPGKGKPLPDLAEVYDPDWWIKKLVRRENLSLLPPALEIRRKVERDLEEIWRLDRESFVRDRVDELNREISRVNRTTTYGPATDIAPFDVEHVVGLWRERRTSTDEEDATD